MGDFNINTLNKNNLSKKYLNLVNSEGFTPLISEATRITERTRSCIDHIHSNFSTSSTSRSIAFEIADHLPIFSVIHDHNLTSFPDTIEFRDFKKFHADNFKSDLRKESWASNKCIDKFTHIFNNVSSKHAPLNKVK